MPLLALLSVFAMPARGQGVVVGPDGRPATLLLQAHRVDATVHDQVAVVTVTHTFLNPGRETVEGTLLFPLPPGAQVSRFSMEIDGKELAGELLSAEEARQLYEDIVRRSLDPALLELTGYRTFRARVFPIPGGATRTITLRYDATLPREGDRVTFRYPLQASLDSWGVPPLPRPLPPERAPRENAPAATAPRSHLRLRLKAVTALTNLYSPSHRIDVQRKDEREAIVTLDNDEPFDGGEFVLYYRLGPADLGATLFTHRPYRDRPGYFMLLLDPPPFTGEAAARPKDLVFVLDTSGSMAGEKLEQAKAALRYILDRLEAHDRFALVAFSSDVDTFRPGLAGPEARDDARYFVDRLEARGGTNIHDALLAALAMLEDSPHGMIVFLTDGLPTSGETDEGRIHRHVGAANPRGVRLFPFGVGYDVNTRLLDGLARETGAFADYIAPEENIEERITAFYDRVRHPVLTGLDLTFDGVAPEALTPRRLPDLYRGGQLILTGRYRTPGTVTVVLHGTLGDAPVRRRYTFALPALEREHDFVARLWATRRVGELLDEIRLYGENDELRDEVIALAKAFGLVTPYTSYLVREEEGRAALPPGCERDDRHVSREPADAALSLTTGRVAVEMSKSIRQMQEAGRAAPPAGAGLRVVAGRTLLRNAAGAWIDAEFDAATDTAGLHRLRFASRAYFTFLRLYPEALAFARLGDRVTFFFRGRYVRIDPEGPAEIDEQTLKRWFD
ncbi:VIT and VWA domain-containing protein [Rhodocaloribacter litoris]|uniref:VIT domain-containing protein n=1 Tax=Rhodocaloribacter litoris TaxID=2558931 RepID=UPI00141F0D7D|nr:VIT domain-containing protein [Rhodocaloribacter litoris]QXD16764.1 VIT and VWA domain-containing protein [Rhodocaloribacter litoris]